MAKTIEKRSEDGSSLIYIDRLCRNLKYRMVASKCISHFLKFILLLLELFLAIKFDMSAGSVSTTKHCKIQAYNIHKFHVYRYLGHGRFVGV